MVAEFALAIRPRLSLTNVHETRSIESRIEIERPQPGHVPCVAGDARGTGEREGRERRERERPEPGVHTSTGHALTLPGDGACYGPSFGPHAPRTW